jgi:hypothetical protein
MPLSLMKRATASLKKRLSVYHPFLLSVFPILALLSGNADQVFVQDALIPMGFMAVLAVTAWLLLWPLYKNPKKRGLAVSALFVLFWGYGPAIDGIRALAGNTQLLGDIPLPVLLALGLAILTLPAFLLWRSRRDFGQITSFLNTASLCAVLIALSVTGFKAARYEYYAGDVENTDSAEAKALLAQTLPASVARPNIYYVILDAYARADILASRYHYDNSSFVHELRQRGFFVPERSYSNYLLTWLSLSSSLNLDFLPQFQPGKDSETGLSALVQNRFRDNLVFRFLKKHGYKVAVFGSGYTLTDRPHADVLKHSPLQLLEFHESVIGITPLRTLLHRMGPSLYYFFRRNMTLFAFEQLPQIHRAVNGPIFAFAHIILPHPPFVFDANGRALSPKSGYPMADGLPLFGAGLTPAEYIDGYTRQVSFANKRVLKMVDEILLSDPGAVIIFQGDHGPRLGFSNSLEQTDLHEVLGIFMACRLPGQDAASVLYDTITPVNLFRRIFNACLGTELQKLPDRSFFCNTYHHFQTMTDVTDRLK